MRRAMVGAYLGLCFVACSLNPQPLPPDDPSADAGAGASPEAHDAGGTLVAKGESDAGKAENTFGAGGAAMDATSDALLTDTPSPQADAAASHGSDGSRGLAADAGDASTDGGEQRGDT